MAEPTLFDVLTLLEDLQRGQADLQRGQADLQRGQADLQRGQTDLQRSVADLQGSVANLQHGQTDLQRGQTEANGRLDAVEAGLSDLRAHVDLGFREVRADIRELDGDLDRHMSAHRAIEEDIQALKARPARAPARAPRGSRTR